jgi:hypothetical protein
MSDGMQFACIAGGANLQYFDAQRFSARRPINPDTIEPLGERLLPGGSRWRQIGVAGGHIAVWEILDGSNKVRKKTCNNLTSLTLLLIQSCIAYLSAADTGWREKIFTGLSHVALSRQGLLVVAGFNKMSIWIAE